MIKQHYMHIEKQGALYEIDILNTERINQLKDRIDETVKFRDKSQANRLEKSQ